VKSSVTSEVFSCCKETFSRLKMKLLVIVIAVLATAAAIQHVGPMPADMPTGSNACNDWCGVRDIDTRRCWAKSGIAKGVVPWVGTVNETKVAYMCDCKEGYYRGTKDGFKTKHGDFCHKLQEAGSDPCNNECGKNMGVFMITASDITVIVRKVMFEVDINMRIAMKYHLKYTKYNVAVRSVRMAIFEV